MFNCEIVKIAEIRYRDHGDYEDNSISLELGPTENESEIQTKILEKMKSCGRLRIKGDLLVDNELIDSTYSTYTVEEFNYVNPWSSDEVVRNVIKTYYIEIHEAQKINGRYYKLMPYENNIF